MARFRNAEYQDTMASIRNDRKSFRKPANEFRPAVHWLWNDRLDLDDLRAQLDKLKDAGFARVIIHGWPGLDPAEYLGDTWFKTLAGVLTRARKKGVQVGMADEFGWPTGRGGGWLTTQPGHMARRLAMDDFIVDASTPAIHRDEFLAAFVVSRTDSSAGVHRSQGHVSLAPDDTRFMPVIFDVDTSSLHGQRLVVFRTVPAPEYLNYLSTDSARAYIEQIHDRYAAKTKKSLGGTLDQFYSTDIQLDPGPGQLPWDPDMLSLFREARDYDLVPNLPALFFDLPGCESVRFHYWTLVAELFREGLPAALARWTADHKVQSSGHFALQQTAKETVRNTGPLMPLYARQDRPGVNLPGLGYVGRRNREEYAQAVVNLKQLGSVADQFGKTGAFAESLGHAGHGLRPGQMRTAALFHIALGVTGIVHHATPASIRGDRKIECSPMLHESQPWWRFARSYTDTLTRAAWLMSQGTRKVGVLVIHAAASLQATWRQPRTAGEVKHSGYLHSADLNFEAIDKHFALLSCALLDEQIDFHYGDEELIARGARVDGKQFFVGAQGYEVVVLPPSLNLRSSTLDILQDFASGGGRVFVAGSAPRFVDGESSPAIARFIEEYATRIVDGIDHYDYSGLIDALHAADVRTAILSADNGHPLRDIRVHRRTWEDRDVLMVFNSGADPLRLTLEQGSTQPGRLERWHPENGEWTALALTIPDETSAVPLEIAPGQVEILVHVPNEKKLAITAPFRLERELHTEWIGRRTSPNALLLTRCRLGSSSRLRSISDVRRFMFKQARKLGKTPPIIARFPFYVSPIVPWTETCRVQIELPENAGVFINDEPISLTDAESTERAIDIELPQLRLGDNELEIRGTYESPWDIEAPIVLGDFHLSSSNNRSFVIEFGSHTIPVGTWCDAGMPFYAGAVSYHAEISGETIADEERVLISVPGLKGTAEVRVNGVIQPPVMSAHDHCNITADWNSERTLIEIEVFNTLGNRIGPHFAPAPDHHTWYERAHYEAPAETPLAFAPEGLLSPPVIRLEKRSESDGN